VVFSAFGSCCSSTSYIVSPVWWILVLFIPSFTRLRVQFSVGVNSSVEQWSVRRLFISSGIFVS